MKNNVSTENFECVICYDSQVVVMEAPCGHKFCASCIVRTGNEVSQKCPLCRAPFPFHLNQYFVTIFPNLKNVEKEKIQETFPLVCGQGNIEHIKMWMNYGLDVNSKGIFGAPPIYFSACNRNLTAVKYLLENGAEVNQGTSEDDWSAIYVSARNGDLQLVSYLVENGAEINKKTRDGITACYIAAFKGNLSIVRYLIENGAEINIDDADG